MSKRRPNKLSIRGNDDLPLLPQSPDSSQWPTEIKGEWPEGHLEDADQEFAQDQELAGVAFVPRFVQNTVPRDTSNATGAVLWIDVYWVLTFGRLELSYFAYTAGPFNPYSRHQ